MHQFADNSHRRLQLVHADILVGLVRLVDTARAENHRQVLYERRVVFVNDLIKEGALWTVAHIDRRTNAQAGLRASG